MAEARSTRASLLIRLRDNADAEAWAQFVEIYSPLIYSFARSFRMQESDAADLVQEVMGEVAKSIARFDYDPQLGRFRSWLFKVAHRTISRMQKKLQRQPVGAGDSQALELLNNHPDQYDGLQQIWDREYHQQLVHWAAGRIRGQFQEDTWQAFWLTAVEEKTPQQVASQLGMSVGSVYVAKSRVTKKLAEKIREVDDSQ